MANSSKLILPSQKILSTADIDRICENDYLGLGLGFDESEIYNIFMDTNHKNLYNNDPVLEILDIMSNPDYFYLTCKHLFNVKLLPIQVAILKQLWIKKFPMLVATRGGAKTWLLAIYAMLRALFTRNVKIIIVAAGFRQAKFMFEYMEDVWRNSPIFRHIIGQGKKEGPKRDIDRCNFFIGDSEVSAIPLGDGCVSADTAITYDDCFGYIIDAKCKTNKIWGNGEFRQPVEFLDNGVKPTKIVVTKKGLRFESTYNHKIKVCRNGIVQWIRSDEMIIGDRILIDRSERWHNGDFQCTEDEAYVLGCMIGDGSWRDKYKLRYTTNDSEHFVPILEKVFNKKFIHYERDKYHWDLFSKKHVDDWIDFWKLKPLCGTLDKTLPVTILSANKKCMAACISGLFDSDGTLQVSTVKGGTSICVSFCGISKKLLEQIQYILLHYGIISRLSSRQRVHARFKHTYRVYELFITGQDVIKFAKEIGFRLPRKQDILLSGIKDKIRTTVIDDTIPDVRSEMIRITKQYSKFTDRDDSLVLSKLQSRKEITFEYAKKFLKKYECIKDKFLDRMKELVNDDIFYDEIISIENGETNTYDIEVPDGNEYCANGFYSHNSKIRGTRANFTISDEFSSISQEIFEVVIKGFSSVSHAPEDKVKNISRIKVLKSLGMWDEALDLEENLGFGNQIVISGTAYYHFNHFYEYWQRYKKIVESKGDKSKLQEIFKGEIPPGFDWTQYCVMRIPYDCYPDGYMDLQQVYQAKATSAGLNYNMEFCAVFSSDSNGFFKRSLVESCVTKNPINLPSGPVTFSATTSGNKAGKYVIGIDPASEADNFAITVLECYPDHRRIVYVWSITRTKMRERLSKQEQGQDRSFYNYCARKIRDLMKVFPTEHIGIDSQGGGITIMEALHEKGELQTGELPLWPYTKRSYDNFWWETEDKPTDIEAGQHFLHMINFSSAEFTVEANHGMRKDFESKTLLFPFFDSVTIAESITMDKLCNRDYDTLEDCCLEIEELKDELATIIHDQTGAGRDRWTTPEIKLPGSKKGRLRKDRYTSLLIANMLARTLSFETKEPEYKCIGTYVGNTKNAENKDTRLYLGRPDITSKLNQFHGKVVQRKSQR